MARRLIQSVFVFLLITRHCYGVAAVDSPLVGKPLQDALLNRRSLNVSETPIRDVCRSLQANAGIALLLDRRVDPSIRVSIDTGYVTTLNVFETLSKTLPSTSLSITEFGAVIGPEHATKRLRTLLRIKQDYVRSQRRRFDPEVYSALAEPRNVSWSHLASPRDLLVEHTQEIGLLITNPDRIPHDLWARAQLPSLPFTVFATLILNQFDLTFELTNDGQLEIVDVPDVIEIEQTHRVPTRDRKRITEELAEFLPELNVTWNRSAVTASATIEVHEKLAKIIRGESNSRVATAGLRDRKMTFKVGPGTPMGSLVVSFRKQGIPIRIEGKSDTELEPLLSQSVEFDLKSVPADEFFRTVFKSWNADVDVQDNQVVIRFDGE